MPLGEFTFEQTREAMEATGDANIILIPLNPESIQPLRDFIGDVPHYERTLDQAFPQLVVSCLSHMQRQGLHDQRVMATVTRTANRYGNTRPAQI